MSDREPLFSKKNIKLLSDPINNSNPITVQVLGICSALAVTAQLKPSIVMTISVMAVLGLANVIISLLRNTIPNRIRIIVSACGYCSFGYPGRPGIKSICIRCKQTTFGFCWADNYQLYYHGKAGSFCTWEQTLAIVP